MEARFRLWWQKIRRRKRVIVVSTAITMVVVVLIIAGYSFDGAGFNAYTQVSTIHTLSGPAAGTISRTEVYQPGKTLWDWLQLLIVPLALAIIALLFNFVSTRAEQKITAQRYEQDKQIADKRYEQDQLLALDKQREDLLQAYLNHISELLLKEHLLSSAPSDEARNIARVRTITTLFQLDARRIGYVYTFLRESGLMSNKPDGSIVSLRDADLDNINFSQAKLTWIDLTGASLIDADFSDGMFARANLSDATLGNANLRGAKLMSANLYDADLSGADLSGAFLHGADLSDANLSGADLIGAILRGARLYNAKLDKANLSGADLSGAILFEVKLKKANLFGAFLARADLFGTDITEEQLKHAKSLEGATMPDGSKHH